MNRRRFLASGISMIALTRMAHALEKSQLFEGNIPQGPFLPFWESLKSYQCPDWFRDAKFGIWAHWSPQCVPEQGDWYARNMYIRDHLNMSTMLSIMGIHRSSDTRIFAIFGKPRDGIQRHLSSCISAQVPSTSSL